ncbi:MAG: hypothetical protein NXI04_26400, partial [Planctomycetaceae bacterium]|nr:hypothetical protein [Planctomycetaceae bacterium]
MPEQENTDQQTTQEDNSQATLATFTALQATDRQLRGTVRFTGHGKSGGQPMQVGRFLLGMLTSA